MSIPNGFYQGNRSEYLAIPALSRLGFTVPVPRQEDHFGIDFVVHLAKVIDNVVTPMGRAFGIQIKSNKDALVFDTQSKRDCLYSLPFFLGVISRQDKDITLTVYNTVNRLHFFWEHPEQEFSLIVGGEHSGVPQPDFNRREGGTGKPILEMSIFEPATPQERSAEIKVLQATMQSWIDLDNENLSLKEQGIGLVFQPPTYETNRPLGGDTDLKEYPYTQFAKRDSLPGICRATEKALTSLSFCLRRLQVGLPADTVAEMTDMCKKVEQLKAQCSLFPATYVTQRDGDTTMHTHSWTVPGYREIPAR